MTAVQRELAAEATVKWIGASPRRKEDPLLLQGRGTFTDDLHLPGMVHVAFVRSPYGHARLGPIDLSPAMRQPGVVAAVAGPEAARPMGSWMAYPGLRDVERYSLAVAKVRYVGEPVAAVVATDPYAAADATELVTVEYSPLPPVVDAEKALEQGSPLLYDRWGDNILLHRQFASGEVERAFGEADVIVEERLRSHRYTATPIEPRGILAAFDPLQQRLTVWASTQFPHVLRTYLAQTLPFPEHRIRVIAPRVGGGFGPKSNVYPDEVTTCLLSLRLQRPVKWIETRREHMLACAHAREQVHYASAAFARDGTLLAVKDRAIADFGVYGPFWTESQPAMLSMTALPGPYRFRSYAYDLYCVVTNKAPYGAHRGFGRPVGAYVMERLMDLAARKLHLDPAEVRLLNLVRPDEMPYTAATGVVYDSGNYPEALHRTLRLANYRGWREEQARLRRQGRHLGIGLATYVEYTAPSSDRLSRALGWRVGGYDVATVRVAPTGKALVYTGVVSQGQSHETIFAQIVADELGVPLDDVAVIEGDTDLCPYGFGTWASRSTVAAGGACVLAARKVREKMVSIAAHLLQCPPEEIEIGAGRFGVKGAPNRGLTFEAIADTAVRNASQLPHGMEPGLEATVFHEPNVPTTCSYAVHLAVVEVDSETGTLVFRGYYVFDDSGRVIHPITVHGQIHGAVAHGIGGTIYEELPYDSSGQLLASTFVDYLVPTARDIPPMEIDHMETPSLTPGGFKGMGEGGSIPTPAVIANAVEDALAPLGITIRDTPLSPERVQRLIRATRKPEP